MKKALVQRDPGASRKGGPWGCIGQPEPGGKGGLGGCGEEEVLIIISWCIEILLPGGPGNQ